MTDYIVAFLSSILEYVVIAIVVFAVGMLGGFIGYKLRQRTNKKKAAAATEE